MRSHLLLPLLHQLSVPVASPDVTSATATLAPSPGQQQALQHAADTQRMGELSPRAGLASRYKPDIRFMLLALRVTAGFACSPKLLAAAALLLARVGRASCVLILECLHFGFVMTG